MPLPEGVVLEKDIEYGNADGHPLHLDLYRPAKLTRPVPALLFIHGGAWKSGKRQDYHFYTAAFARKGYVVATASYRLTRQAPYPAAVQDCKCAVRWLRANAKKYNLSNDLKGGMWAFYKGLPAETTASMTRDILAGKPSELDAWNGAIVRFGREVNIATPVHQFTYHTLLPMERRARTNP